MFIIHLQRESIKKVVATQSQLSPELIQQLVDEYNNGGMKDFEIEMEEYVWKDIKGIESATSLKLTNDFVTVVEKVYMCLECKACKTNRNKCEICGCNTFQETHLSNKPKEPILYTEEEVKSLCLRAIRDTLRSNRLFDLSYSRKNRRDRSRTWNLDFYI